MRNPFKKYSHFRSRLDKPLPSFTYWEKYYLNHPLPVLEWTSREIEGAEVRPIITINKIYSPISDPLYKNAQKKKNKMYSDWMDNTITITSI
jgi:hypothetical protein